MISYESLPEHMRGPARRYIEEGIQPGGFLLAVLANDLLGALCRADRINLESLGGYREFLLTVPSTAKGSYKAVGGWCATGGMKGDLNDGE